MIITNDFENIDLWSNLTFKTKCYRKNFDLTTENENIITEYDGSVSVLRIKEQKLPLIIGEYGFSIWNIELAKLLNINIYEILNAYAVEDSYSELKELVDNNHIDLHKYRKIIVIHSFILRENYRKKGVTEEFIEAMYRDFYNVHDAMIVLAKPFQYNPIDDDYYRNHKFVKKLSEFGDIDNVERIPAFEYYSLKELYNKEDVEFNELKVFTIASKCGFNRVHDNTHLFMFTPEKTIRRMMKKFELTKSLKIK